MYIVGTSSILVDANYDTLSLHMIQIFSNGQQTNKQTNEQTI